MSLGVSYSAAIRACKPRSPQLITFRHDHTHRKLFGTGAVNPRGDLVVTQKERDANMVVASAVRRRIKSDSDGRVQIRADVTGVAIALNLALILDQSCLRELGPTCGFPAKRS